MRKPDAVSVVLATVCISVIWMLPLPDTRSDQISGPDLVPAGRGHRSSPLAGPSTSLPWHAVPGVRSLPGSTSAAFMLSAMGRDSKFGTVWPETTHTPNARWRAIPSIAAFAVFCPDRCCRQPPLWQYHPPESRPWCPPPGSGRRGSDEEPREGRSPGATGTAGYPSRCLRSMPRSVCRADDPIVTDR